MSGANTLDLRFIEEGDSLADEIVHFWESWDSARLEWKKRAKEVEQYVYATSTRETSNANIGGADGEGGWYHSTHIPKITQIYDNLGANYMSALFPHDEYFHFIGNDDEADDKRDAVENYIRTKNKLNEFDTEVSHFIDDWILYGNCFAYVTYEAESSENPSTGETTPGYIGPKVYRISPMDIVFNPLATSFYDSPKIIRQVKTFGELALDVEEDLENSEWSQEVLDRIIENRSAVADMTPKHGEDLDKQTQLRFDGFGSISEYFQSGYVEILHLYGDIYDRENKKLLKNYVVTVVDRKFVIRKQPLDTWTGKPHIYHVQWRRRRDNLWGMGPLDNLVGMQFLINHLENARADAMDRMIYSDKVIEGDVLEPEDPTAPMARYYIEEAGQGQVYNIAPDSTILQADFQIEKKEQQMEAYAGAPRQAMGIRTPGEKTRFEVQQLMNAASRIFQHKINYFQKNFFEKILNAELEVSVRNLSGSDIIQVIDNTSGLVEFRQVTKDDITTNGKIVPIGARHFEKQAQDMQNLTQIMQIVETSPELAQHFPAQEFAKAIEKALDYDKAELFRPYGRLYEQVERVQIESIAQKQLQEKGMINAPSPEEEQQPPQPTPDNSGRR